MQRSEQARQGRIRGFVVGMAALSAILPLASCSAFRPVPTHGGGKRFDEEQRLVSAAVGKTADRMNLSRIRKSRVSLEVNSLDTSGGLQDQNAGNTEKARTPVLPILSGFQNLFGFRTTPWLQSNSTLTTQDIQFLEETVKSRLRTKGFQIVSPAESDVHIIVLVDCLGTNASRDDLAVAYRDDLRVTCELTWYAVDSKTQQVLCSAENLSSSGSYAEWNLRLSANAWAKHELSHQDGDPAFMPGVRSVASGGRGTAPVASLLLAAPNRTGVSQRPGFGRRGGGRQGAEPPIDLPDLPPDLPPDMDPGVLPPIPDLDPSDVPEQDAAEDLSKMGVADLVRKAWAQSREKNVEGLRAAIDALEAKKPDAPALEKLKERLGQLDKKKP